MSDQPPPPPPHGTNPRRSGPNLPPGKYDIFIIPPHSSGAGFLYLPSLKPNVNSFAAGFATALVLVVLFQSMAPAFRVWYSNFQGMGNMGMLLLVIAVGVGAWAIGRTQNEGNSSSGNRGDSGHSWSYNPGDNGHSGGPYSGTGPPPHSRAPDPDGPPPPPPPHSSPPPPRSGPQPNTAGTGKPNSSWQERPEEHSEERSREHRQEQSQERPQAETTKGSWERAREETRRKEEERKAREAEQRKKEEIARRIKELREKEARERARREQEAKERREKEAREREEREREIRERLEREARIREEHEQEIRAKLEREARIREEREREVRERLEKEAREAREQQEKAAREVREKEEKEAREKEQREKEQREREQQEKARREKELRERRLQEARERELRERLEREKTLREKLEREAKEREAKEREAVRLKEAEVAKAAEEAKAKAKEAETTRRGTYAFSSVGERTNPWPNGKPPTQAPSPTKSTRAPSVAPSVAPSAAPSTATPSAAASSARRPPPPTAQSFRGTEDDAYSYRPYDQPRSHNRRKSGETVFTESSYAPSQSTSRTTPPPSMRGPYTTKDPDKIVIKAVYGFLNQFSKTPASQLLSGVGHVTDGLILRITTEGLFIDDDVRGVPQREWDVKAWTLKQMEVWCPAHSTADSNASPRVANKSAPPRFKFSARGQQKTLMGDDADGYLTELLHACKDDCRMGPHGGFGTASSRGTSSTGEWKSRGLHVLRATIRDQEGKRFVFVLGEEEGWKMAVGLQRLRKGTQVRQLGIQPMPLTEARNAFEMLGW
ncbi:hypothetical protein F4801DRAFT_561866 [Xylaria longipes]|nr:hypothetical protein F4801DRAFT_561866 [Xylaria longipes]